jgi:hypothetical protein
VAAFRNTIGELTGLRPRKPWHDGKTEHASRGKAEAAIRSLYKRGENERGQVLRNGARLNVYECWEDGTIHFHVGHNTRGGKRTHGEKAKRGVEKEK